MKKFWKKIKEDIENIKNYGIKCVWIDNLETETNNIEVINIRKNILELKANIEDIGLELIKLFQSSIHLQFASIIFSCLSRIHLNLQTLYGLLHHDDKLIEIFKRKDLKNQELPIKQEEPKPLVQVLLNTVETVDNIVIQAEDIPIKQDETNKIPESDIRERLNVIETTQKVNNPIKQAEKSNIIIDYNQISKDILSSLRQDQPAKVKSSSYNDIKEDMNLITLNAQNISMDENPMINETPELKSYNQFDYQGTNALTTATTIAATVSLSVSEFIMTRDDQESIKHDNTINRDIELAKADREIKLDNDDKDIGLANDDRNTGLVNPDGEIKFGQVDLDIGLVNADRDIKLDNANRDTKLDINEDRGILNDELDSKARKNKEMNHTQQSIKQISKSIKIHKALFHKIIFPKKSKIRKMLRIQRLFRVNDSLRKFLKIKKQY